MTLNVNASFDEMECLNSNFSTTVSHKGQPFGMTENVITVSKENCKVTIEHKKLKFMKNKYVVDVCVAPPVHIKSGSGAIEVLKRKDECGKKSKENFVRSLSLSKRLFKMMD